MIWVVWDWERGLLIVYFLDCQGWVGWGRQTTGLETTSTTASWLWITADFPSICRPVPNPGQLGKELETQRERECVCVCRKASMMCLQYITCNNDVQRHLLVRFRLGWEPAICLYVRNKFAWVKWWGIQLLTYMRLVRLQDPALFSKINFDRDVILDQVWMSPLY
jgi:hypothetical protein